jgi:hypothetical protein
MELTIDGKVRHQRDVWLNEGLGNHARHKRKTQAEAVVSNIKLKYKADITGSDWGIVMRVWSRM